MELIFELAAKQLGVACTTLYKIHNNFDLHIYEKFISSYEIMLSKWFDKHNIFYQTKVRNVIYPYELDFYLPQFNLAIEIDGLYWHSVEAGKDKNYHRNKTNLCKEKEIRLIHIFEDEWVDNEKICLDILSRILNINQTKIMARKCQVKELSNNESKIFLKENHLQGYTSASINLGLFYEGKLVQLLTFKKARYNKNIEWEIIRQSNKIGIQITGGLQKLWSYFIKKYQPKSIVSYCDLRWFLGESYNKLNFELKTITNPQYWYFDNLKRFHRSKFTKKNCIKILTEKNIPIPTNITENYITKNILCLDKIYDCGQQTWTWFNETTRK